MAKKTVKDLDVKGKKVIVRADLNVPHKGSEITNDNRVKAAVPTLKYLVDNGAKVILMSHLGKVKTEEDKAKNDLGIVAPRLQELLPEATVKFCPVTRGAELEEMVAALQPGEILLMQNTRYEKGESKNDPELGQYWASLGDMFVEDAFGSVHRAHASTVGIPSNLPENALGFLVEKEVTMLGRAVDEPVSPFVAILGGAKVSDKIAVIENMLDKADKVIVGGGMAYTFMKAMGHEVGNSLLEEDKIELAKTIMAKGGDKLILPVDNVVADKFANDAEVKVVDRDIPEGWMGLDIGPKSIELFKETLQGAKTVVWNGPMGVFEMPNFAKGTLAVCEAISELPDAVTVIGGGDSAAAAIQLGFEDKFSHISTGGGASLEYMEGKVLPGIAIITEA
ncbi:phosphoglycerate kinase [Allobaculum stercoricanis]|uniref:phosphoglycerate kinase n=1 Tax=Allobaculum stercoricanis TaxID=174709 RepID=UPI00036CF3EA|nr:phosphoglycerate kinase [Allobaculum stercoricanis]